MAPAGWPRIRPASTCTSPTPAVAPFTATCWPSPSIHLAGPVADWCRSSDWRFAPGRGLRPFRRLPISRQFFRSNIYWGAKLERPGFVYDYDQRRQRRSCRLEWAGDAIPIRNRRRCWACDRRIGVPVVANRRLERHPASRPVNPDAVVGVNLPCVAFAVAPPCHLLPKRPL